MFQFIPESSQCAHHGFPLHAFCESLQSLGSSLSCDGDLFLIAQMISRALCVMWDQKCHAEEVVLKLTTSCWRRKTFAGWFQTIWSFSSSAKGICIWLEAEFIQLCSLSCHSYNQWSEPGQKKVTFLQKAFHTQKPVNSKTCEFYSQTDSLMHNLMA